MSFQQVAIPGLAAGETGYRLSGDPGDGWYVAVAVKTAVRTDGGGHYLGVFHTATARAVDKAGIAQRFPVENGPEIRASHSHTSYDGSVKGAQVVAELLDGVAGNPEAMPSPIRHAIAAAEAIAAAL